MSDNHYDVAKPFILQHVTDHSMGASIIPYSDMKIHQRVKLGGYKRIIVQGGYDRETTEIFVGEKDGKRTNWQRPTARLIEGQLHVYCYPGREYVRHYAALIATWLHLTGGDHSQVFYILPDESLCWQAILQSGLEVIPPTEWLILGYGLPHLAGESEWVGNDVFLYSQKSLHGQAVTYLIFQHSFWGDILGRITRYLIHLGFHKIIFTAKLGGLNPEHIPNQTLATGSRSFLEGEMLHWIDLDVFRGITAPNLVRGVHCNNPSVLFETNEWLKFMSRFDFVESEIGYFARACVDAHTPFGYLHFVSNNLVNPHREDLSNEREPAILEKRQTVKDSIRTLVADVIR